LLAEFRSLWAKADALWDQRNNHPAFAGYVSADYEAVYQSLANLRGQVFTVLEWGSGLGVVTIMASRMGFEAYGIESELELVEYSEEFARAYAPEARFAQGSFVPDEFQWDPASDTVFRTIIDSPSAYDAFDMELRDFDLIYAYPWPQEITLYHSILRKLGRHDSLFLYYDAREGIDLVRVETDSDSDSDSDDGDYP
jgi:hypothetical protein